MDQVAEDPFRADLSPRETAILRYAIKLTQRPQQMSATDVEELRRAGLNDPAIQDVAQVTSLFNYYNRLADGLGVDEEPEW